MVESNRWWNLLFPSVKKYQKRLDATKKNVEEIKKTLVIDGSAYWFIKHCREHEDEVCDDAP